ncbi:MAG: formylglycine-generating enzyme family protein [Fibromonadaceae bacterium]|jgi:formylglycine-generating enzyme required for sulfatase activity|nr:formylglycine-generating enzyme family protein [Fibromonadaceae bacterium]
MIYYKHLNAVIKKPDEEIINNSTTANVNKFDDGAISNSTDRDSTDFNNEHIDSYNNENTDSYNSESKENLVNDQTNENSLPAENTVVPDNNKLMAMIVYKNLFPHDFRAFQARKGSVFAILEKKDIKINIESNFKSITNNSHYCSLLKTMINKKYLDMACADYVTYPYKNSLYPNDEAFVRKVKTQEKMEPSYSLKEPMKIIKWLNDSDFYQPGIFNIDLFYYLLKAPGYESHRKIFLDQLKSTGNYDFVKKAFLDNKFEKQVVRAISLDVKKELLELILPSLNKKESETYRELLMIDMSIDIELAFVQGGTFKMGGTTEQGDDYLNEEKPVHNVTLNDFYIGKYPVTQKLWVLVMGDNPSFFKGNYLPVEQVSWHDTQKFISKLNFMTGKKYRLPTEAEWEFAARGGVQSKGYKFAGSNDPDRVAWYNNQSTHPVGTKQSNELGMYDMSGNVLEWVADWYGEYNQLDVHNPSGPESGFARVLRGGSWRHGARHCRVSARGYEFQESLDSAISFRLALTT